MKPLLSLFLAAASSIFCAASYLSERALSAGSGAADTVQDPPAGDTAKGGAPARTPTFDFAPGGPISDAQLGDYHVAVQCAVDGKDVGTMTIALWSKEAPITVRNFLRLCDEGFYDGVKFHRIMRNFMVQGGNRTDPGGSSPHGTIKAEFSDAPERAHGYGVISMARVGGQPDSASCQFFLCCDEGENVWNLDGQYASFGRITSGVAALEALANVPTRPSEQGENSAPAKPAVITRAEVKSGPAPTGETIARPAPDLGGAPATVVIQHVLVAFKGAPRVTATRSKEEAETLAKQLVDRAKGGEDFAALVREFSADPIQPGDETPGTYRLNNRGARNQQAERRAFDLRKLQRTEEESLIKRLAAGEITREQHTKLRGEFLTKWNVDMQAAQEALGMSRDQMVQGFGDVAFSLAVGDVGLAAHDPQKSPYGWHVIKRLE